MKRKDQVICGALLLDELQPVIERSFVTTHTLKRWLQKAIQCRDTFGEDWDGAEVDGLVFDIIRVLGKELK
jgi:hypothetical protein